MKRIIRGGALFLSVMVVSLTAGLVDIEKAGKQVLAGDKKIFFTEIESRQEVLKSLQQQKRQLEEQNKEYLNEIQNTITHINAHIKLVKEQLARDPNNDLLTKKVALLDEWHDTVKKREQEWKLIISLIDQRIEQLQEYLNDPDFKKFKESRIVTKQIYSFDDLQNIHQITLDEEKQIDQLTDQEKNIITELENKRRAATITVSEFKKKTEEREQLLKETEFVFDEQQFNELWNLQEKLFEEKKRLDELNIEESEQKLELIKLKLFMGRRRLEVLKKIFREIKPSVRVTEADISTARDELGKKKQQSNVIKRDYYQEIEKIEARLQEKRSELEKLSRRYNIALDQDLDRWAKELKVTTDGCFALAQVGAANDQLLFLQRRKDYLKALLDLEDEKIRHEEINIRIKETFHKIRYRKFVQEDDLAHEIKKYDLLKAGLKASLSSYQEKKNATNILLEAQKKAQDNLKQIIDQTREQKNLFSKDHVKEFTQCMDLFHIAAGIIKEQINTIGKISATYGDTLAVLSNTSKQIEFITAELGTITIWHRPEHAVSWEGLNSIVPDIKTFISDLRSYLTQLSIEQVVHWFSDMMQDRWAVLFFIIKTTILVMVLLFIRAYLPRLMSRLRSWGSTYGGIRVLSYMLVFLGGFFIRYFNFIVPWLIIFISSIFYTFPDPYLYILFYLASIFYLIYVAQRFVAYFKEFNVQHNYIFINREFQSRFILVFSSLLYATIVIVFFREAFILGNYPRSELPTILLAVNFIILQIALISLISKEQILSLIPQHNSVWEWIYKQVDRYYYLLVMIVIAIIVMSNPYVGFGRLVLFVLRRVFYTIALIIILFWIHQGIKRSSSHLFFSVDEDEVTKERFPNAKTWYGLTIIFIFLVFMVVGLIITAKMWGWPERLADIDKFADIKSWLQEPFTHAGQEAISVWTILVLLLFVLAGIGVSFAVNRFVLGRIFDILLIEPGIQNTVSSIVYYFIFISAIFLGFSAVNLGGLVIYIMGALILGIGWVIKDPISDFVAYFVILVQRPLKVGDFVKIEEELIGVVRKITPRTVILRRKNSTTIILPNSFIINKPITNWNYVRGFIAHNDIILTVSYKADPIVVQKILYDVLAESSYILKNPKPVIRLDDFSLDGYVFMVRGFLSSNYTLDQWDIASDIRIAIVKALRHHNIAIAVPTRVLVSFDPKDARPMMTDATKTEQ